MKRTLSLAVLVLLCAVFLASAAPALGWTPLAVKSDPLLFMPGSQPGDVSNFENASRCENCHSGYNPAVEPGSNWRGSMMAQAARDPLWLACLTVGAQDSIWVLGNPNATDICIRCHSPQGWLEGASDPTNTSALSGNQFDGVACDFCHRAIDPFTTLGQPDVPADTDSTAISLAQQTLQMNIADLGLLTLFDGSPFLSTGSGLPTWYDSGLFPNYVENGAGQYFAASASNTKYGPYYDANARHQWNYSRFHKSKEFCHACHDVSNPVLENALADPSGTTKFAAASYFHVERTSSEFLLSAYGMGGADTPGIPGVGIASKCQDCHMRAVTGIGCNKAGTPVRTDLPLHDLTGGNQWVSGILASVDQGYAGYDAYNYAILSGAKYSGAQIDVAGIQGFGDALARGQQRAIEQLKMAATLQEVSNTDASVTLRVINNTGHKLISGFPEGRRMFLNVKWFAADGTELTGDEINKYQPVDANGNGGDIVSKADDLVWEAEMGSTLTGEDKSFHFALADHRYKDNRIPPLGFDIAHAAVRLAEPVWAGVSRPDLFTAAEYAGGYDEVVLPKPVGAATYVATLYYQSTSKAYVQFLRDEVRGTGSLTLSSPTPSGETNAYIAQTDAFFSGLKGWGDAIWDLWVHNGAAAPVQMAVLGASPQPPTPITVDPPTSLRASYSRRTGTVALTWSEPASGANGYYVYKSSTSGSGYVMIGTPTTTTFADSGPFTSGVTEYYVVTAYKVDKLGNVTESTYSNEAKVTPK